MSVTARSPSLAARCPGLLHRAYSAVVGPLRASPTIHRVLFGYRPSDRFHGHLWDWTTLLLIKALHRYLRPGMRLLDMGTGPVGVLAIYAKKRLHGGRVCGVDHVAGFLPAAADSAARCGAEVEFRESSLFSSVTGRYEIILFNAPYMEAQAGRRLGTLRSEFDETRWSGGETGMETIERFLEAAPAHLAPRGLVLLGVNHFYLPHARCAEAFQSGNLQVIETVQSRILQACVYVLQPQGPLA